MTIELTGKIQLDESNISIVKKGFYIEGSFGNVLLFSIHHYCRANAEDEEDYRKHRGYYITEKGIIHHLIQQNCERRPFRTRRDAINFCKAALCSFIQKISTTPDDILLR